jgi:outer membrane lipoprotein-sorting protein
MARKLFLPSALALAAAAALLLGACKAGDTAGGSSATTRAASNNSAAGQSNSGQSNGGQSNSGGGTTTVSADGARRVTPAEVQQMVADGKAVIYDTRSKGAYDAEHVKGALSMPSNEVGERTGELPKDKTLVFYCT